MDEQPDKTTVQEDSLKHRGSLLLGVEAINDIRERYLMAQSDQADSDGDDSSDGQD